MRVHRPSRVILFAVLSAAPAMAAPGDVSWELIRPSNTGVPGDFTQTIFIDDDDSPWIGGYIPFWEEGGVGHFDGTNWRVLGNVDCPQIASPRFNDIVKTDDGIMWIGSDQGLLRFDPGVEPWCVTRFHPSNSGIAASSVNNISIAPDGTLWMACDTVGGSSAGGLSQYDPATGDWNSWDTSNGLPWWSGWDWVDYVAVQPDSTGGYTVWFGSNEMGLTTFKDGLFIWYGSPTPPPGSPMPQWVYGKNSVDDEGNLLLGTDQGMALRAKDGTYTLIPPPPAGGGITDLMPSGHIAVSGSNGFSVWDGAWSTHAPWGGSATYAMAEDSTGAFWAGGIGAAAKLVNGSWQRHRLTNSGMIGFFISSIALAPNGDVAMDGNAGPGTGGFDIMHPDRTWTNANVRTYGIGLPWPYPTDNTEAVAYRPTGELLFAPTNNGVKEYDGKSDFRELIPNSWPIRHIGVSDDGRAWAATGNGSLFRENDDGEMPVDERFTSANSPLPQGQISDIVADPHDPETVWVGAAVGLAKTNGTDWSVIPREAFGLDQNSTGYFLGDFDIAQDGTIWAASGRGLFHYDPATGLYDTYDPSNSPLPSDDVHNVKVAPDGSVWISMFDEIYPYPGGVAQLKDGVWRLWQQPTSPLPHNQVQDLQARSTPNGYEIWIATASEAVAVISVEGENTCPADFDADGDLDFFDISMYLAAFNAGAPIADFNGDGLINFFDISDLITAFNAGCP